MKEDYLWNKSGGDPEVEELEETLAVLRYRPMPAPPFTPAIPVPQPSWGLRLRFAFAVSAAAIVTLSAWMWAVQEGELAETNPAGTANTRTAIDVPAPATENPPAEKRASAEGSKKPAYASAGRRKPRTPDRRSSARPSSAALTREEQYAYDRLMLALSITGSKLKIVRDTIDGTPEEKGRR